MSLVLGRLLVLLSIVPSVTVIACRSVEVDASARSHPRAPTLEEIFLEPSIAGVTPRAESLSPDGRWLLLRWSPDAATPGAAPLRLLEIARPGDTGSRGTPLAELITPPAGSSAELERVAWLPTGARLVAKCGREVLLYDAPTARTARLVVEAPAVEADAPDPHRRFQGSIRRLDLIQDGAFLDVLDDAEAYRVPLGETWPELPIPLDAAEHVSADLDAAPIELAFNSDSSIVFGAKVAPREFNAPADGEADDGDLGGSAPPLRPHVLHRADDRLVTLEAFDPELFDNVTMSPDGRFVFALEYDRSHAPAATIVPDFLTERVTTRTGRRQLADDGPDPFHAWIWDTSSGARRSFFGDSDPRLAWTSSLAWAPTTDPHGPARALFSTLSADHRERVVYVWTEGFLEQRFVEYDDAWIGGPVTRARWTPDGSAFVVGSERCSASTTPNRAQLFLVPADGGAARQLTAVEGEVSDWRFTEDGGLVLAAIRDDPAEKCIGWLPAAALDGTEPPAVRWYPQPAGFNASLTPGATPARLVFTHERLFQPAELFLATPEGATRLTDTTPRAFREIAWIEPERITVAAADGTPVRAHVFVPPDWSLGQAPRPAVVFVHGAGYLQNVTEAMTEYPKNLLFHSRLARLGLPVIDVDYRGSAGYGREFRTAVQYHLGGLDLADIHAVVDDQIERGLVDPQRVGVYGGSYGGFLTMMALFTAPERWAVGCALRSVTDWRTYHPRYTQPRLGKPSTHAEAYRRSSPIDHAQQLEDPLLILHGLLDSNVFAQDSIRLIEDLIDLGKDFDAMLYPSQGHGFDEGAHWLDEYRRIERYLLTHLKAEVFGDPS
ncbi:MAG: prolyl oligopeptidase family serine peptidase [Planctomycetota bacterium]